MFTRSAALSVTRVLAVSIFSAVSASGLQSWSTTEGETIAVPEGGGTMLTEGDLSSVLDSLLTEAVDESGPALAVAVMLGGELYYSGARGLADLEHGVPADEATAFDVASVSKSVTGAALATLVEAGEVELDASVRAYLPELSATYDPVRIRHLVHHTGGVEDAAGVLALAGWRSGDGEEYEDVVRLLGGLQHLRFEPGTQHMYSNGGYVLLAEVVRRVTGQALPDWASENLFRPLSLRTARFASGDGALIPGRAAAYSGARHEERLAARTTRYGDGGLFVSATDLVRWAEALRTGAGLPRGVVQRTRELGRLADGSRVEYAFGLGHSVREGREVWSHSGSSPGARSYLAFYPDHALSVVAVANTSEGVDPGQFAGEIASLLLGPGEASAEAGDKPRMMLISDVQEAPALSAGIRHDPDALLALSGTYELDNGLTITVGADGEQLLIGFGDEPSIPVYPTESGAEEVFVLPQPGWEFRFEPASDRLTLEMGDAVMAGSEASASGRRRVLAPLDAESVAELEGLYRSEELGTTYAVVWRDGSLRLEHPRHGSLALTHFGDDEFTLPGRALAHLQVLREGEIPIAVELTAYSWGARSRFDRID